jgi:hypothetical protein
MGHPGPSMHARSLRALMKARAFGMTPSINERASSSEALLHTYEGY